MKMNKDYENYLNLKKEIEKYNYHYYEKNESLISDKQFDDLLKKLVEIEKLHPEYIDESSPTEHVGGYVNEKFSKVKHNAAMLSLANTYNINDIKDFNNRIQKLLNSNNKIEYVLELKLDGISISIIYENGILVRAVTRGDGIYGEDVTENVMQIKNIPHKLNKNINIEVRGEIVFPISKFNKLNELREINGEPVFANPRNAASGTIRQLDMNVVKERDLDCYLYYVVNSQDFGIKTHMESINLLKDLGFNTTGVFEIYNDFSDIEHAIEIWNTKRKKLDYETDGLVLKINDITLYEKLGYTAKSPRWAIAYKFKPDQAITKIISIDYQVGRTGVVTPVANFEPANLSGSVVKRASLHNFDEIYKKDIRIFDTVVVEKAAEIIPQVINVLFEKRTGIEKRIEKPKLCPSCGYELHSFENIIALKCINPYCPEQLTRLIEYFVSRDCMNIKGLGTKIIRKLIDLGLITNILDLYNLKNLKDELIQIDKMGEKNVENLLNSIEKSINNSFDKVIYSLGINYVGKTTASLICDRYQNIDDLIDADVKALSQIKGVGEKVANSVYSYFRNANSIRIINGLKEIGFNLKNVKQEKLFNNNISGKSFLATGTFTNFKREDIKEIINKYNGVYLSAVSKNLDYLIAGEKAGSKLEKATNLGIKILTEDEFLILLGKN
ncbi:NAD-dependent DNA ligase LigA [Caviibacter abscessus]|uniref:NAD-dependent DNA ligase LigA n=2 Tax=Caviibacter abscessus TaxID=1766719 RepID=UPI0008305EC1|nr:NAD-dependent DNA ligase LigA [Caviibacter abscessus]